MLVYLRGLKDLYVPQWKLDKIDKNDLESYFKISWSELGGYAQQAAQGMAFLEENKVKNLTFIIFQYSIEFYISKKENVFEVFQLISVQ